jgi:hypothetical protein
VYLLAAGLVVYSTNKQTNKTSCREVHTTTTQIESTDTCPDKVVTKTPKRRVTLQQEQPLKTVKVIDRNM